MRIIARRDYDEMSVEAARFVSDAIKIRPQMSICLPTGTTPKGMYADLIRRHRASRLDFSRTKFFNLDEYFGLRSDHPHSFRVYLWRQFFNHVNVRPANVYLPDDAYEETIRRVGGIDLLISGIGLNGHIAFNEPGSPFDSRTRIVTLAESTLIGIRPYFSEDELPRQALTIGIGTIMDARGILLLASGRTKAEIVANALCGPVTTDVPASVLQRHPNVTVIADEEALALVSNSR